MKGDTYLKSFIAICRLILAVKEWQKACNANNIAPKKFIDNLAKRLISDIQGYNKNLLDTLLTDICKGEEMPEWLKESTNNNTNN